MEEFVILVFGTLLSLALWIILFLVIRKLVLWYWKVDRTVAALEGMYELQCLLHAQTIRETRLTFINKATQQLLEMSIEEYLKKDNKQNYRIK